MDVVSIDPLHTAQELSDFAAYDECCSEFQGQDLTNHNECIDAFQKE